MSENHIFLFLAVAVLIEATVESLKPLWDKSKAFNIDILASLLISIAVCVLGGLDVFAWIGFPLIVPFVGSVLTGIILSRGAGVAHELVKLLMNIRGKQEAPSAGLNAGKVAPK